MPTDTPVPQTTEPDDWPDDFAADESCLQNDADAARWKAAYCQAFRETARSRNWPNEAIESGWLDDLPDNALNHYGRRSDPAECARRDVPECEEPADAD